VIELKISDVRIYPVKGRHWPRFPWLFVEIETSNGLQGFGEALAYIKSTRKPTFLTVGWVVDNP
jgi:L-alanine-DL-glutamate epimerase-like enolase superfamily enzyme